MDEIQPGDEVFVSVLGYREDGEWCALALEMDLRGHGRTFREALEDLRESMTMQIGFALSRNEPGMIFFPADPMYFSLYAQVRNERIMALTADIRDSTETETVTETVTQREYAITGIPIPPAHIVASRREGFARSGG